jgi:uncharacterized membrane protein
MRSSLDDHRDGEQARVDTLDLEGQMRRVSQVLSAVAVALMLAGLLGSMLSGSALSLPGSSVMPLSDFLQLPVHPLGLAAMSAGIVMLALLPVIRVLLALGIYVRQRVPVNALTALVVLVELLISMRAGG